MNESRLDEDLKALSKRPPPDLPSDFNATVWSKVQSRETRARAGGEGWLKAFLSAFPRPQWAGAALALAILAGWILGRATTGSVKSPTETTLAAAVTGEVIDMACFLTMAQAGRITLPVRGCVSQAGFLWD